jgi:chromosomal replication initiation ATPase DnaA
MSDKRIWRQVRQDIREHIHDGVNIDKSWFSDDKVKISTNDGDVIVEGRNAFFRSFIKNNYEGHLERAFARYGFSLDRYEHNALRFIKNEEHR